MEDVKEYTTEGKGRGSLTLAPAGHTIDTIHGDAMFFNPVLFEHAQRVATMLSKSELVPKHFQNNVANVMIALNLAGRMRIDVFGLMQSMYIVHGRPGVEGKLAISLINGSGRFSPLQYKIEQTGKKTEKEIPRWDSCQAYATILRTGEVINGPVVTWQMAVAEGWTKPKGGHDGKPPQISKWQTLPDLMFSYRSAMFFCRVHCPELLIGMRTIDEIQDTVEMVATANGTFQKKPETSEPALTGAPTPGADPVIKRTRAQVRILNKFDKLIPEEIDIGRFSLFLHETARANNLAVDDIKTSVIEQNSMAALLGYFATWDAGAEGSTLGPKPETVVEMAPGSCPNDSTTTYTKEYCNECKSRPGCPVWEG